MPCSACQRIRAWVSSTCSWESQARIEPAVSAPENALATNSGTYADYDDAVSVSGPGVIDNHDGTWSWSTKGQEQGHGRIAVRGDRVVLHETWSRHGNTEATNAPQETIVLKRTGDELWGVTRAFMPSAQNAVELKRIAS